MAKSTVFMNISYSTSTSITATTLHEDPMIRNFIAQASIAVVSVFRALIDMPDHARLYMALPAKLSQRKHYVLGFCLVTVLAAVYLAFAATSRQWFLQRAFNSVHGTKQTSGAAREPWLFNVTRDERDYGLTKEQCNIAFPELWEEIDRAVEVRKRHGVPQITEDIDLEGRGLGFMRVLIYDRQVSFCEYTH